MAKYAKSGNINPQFYDEVYNFAGKELPVRLYSDYIAFMLLEFVYAYEELTHKNETQNFSKAENSASRSLKNSAKSVRDIVSDFIPRYSTSQTLEQSSFTQEDQTELAEKFIKLKQDLENSQRERDELDKRVGELLLTISKSAKNGPMMSLETLDVIQKYKYFKDQRLTSVSKQVFELIKPVLPQGFDPKFTLATIKSLLSEYTLERSMKQEMLNRAQSKIVELNEYLQSLFIDRNILNQVNKVLSDVSLEIVVNSKEYVLNMPTREAAGSIFETYESKHDNTDFSTEDNRSTNEQCLTITPLLLPKDNNELGNRANNLANDETQAPNSGVETTLEQGPTCSAADDIRESFDKSINNMAGITLKSVANIDEDPMADHSQLQSSKLITSEVSSPSIKDNTDYNTLIKDALQTKYNNYSQFILLRILSKLNLVDKINFSDEISNALNELNSDGQQLVKDIMDTDPPGQLWTDDIGSIFDPGKHEALRGYSEYGTITLTVTPGYKIGQSVQVKALVITG